MLAGRRERRRTKKAIIAPKDSDDEDTTKHDEDKPKNGKTKTKKARKGDISAGLALMHGFSATNVGAVRLTVSANAVLEVIRARTYSAHIDEAEPRSFHERKGICKDRRFFKDKFGRIQ